DGKYGAKAGSDAGTVAKFACIDRGRQFDEPAGAARDAKPVGYETDGGGQRQDRVTSHGNCQEHWTSISVGSIGWTDAGDGRIHAGGGNTEGSGVGGSHDYDADFGRTLGRRG